MPSVTLKIDQNILDKMHDFYKEDIEEVNHDYILWKTKTIDDVVITIYSSKKGLKALFSGENALNEAKIWNLDAEFNVPKEKPNFTWKYLGSQIGSDEVGTGDFFGPVIVVAAYVDQDIIPYLRELKVNDSKKLTDQKILEIVPEFLDKVTFSKLTCTNEKYNKLVANGYSMNKIKAILHNHALLKVREKINKDEECFVDQFSDVDLYYSYIQNEPKILNKKITFETKGESKYPSIAVASMIARYSFLKEMEVLESKYAMELPKGASTTVDEAAQKFKNKFGRDELMKICKANFKNLEKIK